MEQAYVDKLDGKIPEEFWIRKNTGWQAEEGQILESLRCLNSPCDEHQVLNSTRILELANKAHFLYLRQTAVERAKLLRMVVSNCRVDAVSLYPVYKKPFDMIARRAKTEEWRPQGDSNPRYRRERAMS